MLECMGIDSNRLTCRFPDGDYRVTDVHGEVATRVLA
jgi:hypothetical protein